MWTLVISLTALMVSVLSLAISAWALIHYVAKDKSTHSIQYVPVSDPKFDAEEKTIADFDKKEFDKATDNLV